MAHKNVGLIRTVSLAVLLAGVSQITASAAIVWDQGPETGTPVNINWDNDIVSQSFAEQVTFASDTVVGGYNFFDNQDLSLHNGVADFRLRIFSDASGQPGSVIYSADLAYTSAYTEDGFSAYHFDFGPQTLLAGVQYWVGMTGTDFDPSQMTLYGLAGGDSRMAQFNGGDTFSYFTDPAVGDQMFQLTGARTASVPDTASTGLLFSLSMGLLLGLRRRFGARV